MINLRQNEILIVNGLQEWLAGKGYNASVIMANQTTPIPAYPYIAYTVTTPVVADMKTYGILSTGTRIKPITQRWSFTVQSGDATEADNVVMTAYDWFVLAGNTYLSDNGIVVKRVENITNRDNLVSIEYEYRRGFDVEFLLLNEISKADSEQAGYIETAPITYEED